MKLPNEKFCILPWISLETSPVGTVRPCCLADDEISDNSGNKFDLGQADLSQVQNSEYMKKLRQQFLDGEQPRTCRKCWNEERAGRTSKRMHTLDRLKHVITDTEWTAEAKPLQFLDLKLGNICNLKCRICGSWSSSTFAVEELNHVADPKQPKENNFHYQMLRKGAWPRNNTVFWEQMDSIISEIRYIEFTGGEPFMIREHFDLLKMIVDRGHAHHVEIHYNTNGTQWVDTAEEIWRHFRTVEIAFSIDDLGPRFEYQRSNAVWAEVVENIQRFKELQQRHSNIRLQVCSTVNVFNVMYLGELANWIDQQNFDFVYWNMMQDPFYFCIAQLPETAKLAIRDRLNAATVSDTHRKEFNRIIDFMMNGANLNGEMTISKIYDLDRRRYENLAEHHPELAKALGI
jgi:organic radical activating enzyme